MEPTAHAELPKKLPKAVANAILAIVEPIALAVPLKKSLKVAANVIPATVEPTALVELQKKLPQRLDADALFKIKKDLLSAHVHAVLAANVRIALAVRVKQLNQKLHAAIKKFLFMTLLQF